MTKKELVADLTSYELTHEKMLAKINELESCDLVKALNTAIDMLDGMVFNDEYGMLSKEQISEFLMRDSVKFWQ